MRSIFTSFNLPNSQSGKDFLQLRQYCTCTDLIEPSSDSEEQVIIFAEDRKLFIFMAANNLEPVSQARSLIANKRSPTAGFSGKSQDGREAQQAVKKSRQAEKQEFAGGRTPVDCGKTAVESVKAGTAFGDGPSQDLTPIKSEGRREWNKHNDEHCLYGNS
jgi:hypothetical protein